MPRELHPLRAQRWSISDANPWLAWLAPAGMICAMSSSWPY